ncbi:hypothetical protein A2962_02110 [Candidatus Woesebacteria bacterium RIFCSPLOWO2_01_FULL_39_61]|uniref:Antitoxin SocA-like Panacea domain-containing protein n=1 Tax=Candidatus Woesebacteria bacterium RIFCSPHIGHO2_02_FULL_39_13 TaxID=1802505 RepID=A0A1F7YYD4_9BACT|nr:MAG: hypothetical protein A2692_03110 [Candidatus Woesebacteria bacterium RIFCSPHIGHO2_01_FULL_39_95]OGM32342.1 MAG: hypothetical protein A3D01_04745 [Candidatus Woesebacteria bacterium RIFCSPHIGHO2_02_FULL_39_13]OGM37028.1 MAG: hypothetical protein A3E13_03705 [Candidatus Woesebacteria bacterium RIFCSPHIGHO2_12_FULL_40_20]OGM67938.1 MAG: hypothetical protein A2962_02110 [Candidatus Woesebacteria bacterium RIFCSPLOWO2_01_FULL_39_61]OGM72231.1 MAG: hypothetical protein A3H19_02255 [Candidatus
MDKKSWLLLVVSSSGDTGLTPIQLQKSLFIIGQSLKLKDFYDFVPYSYGPFDSQIYIDAETLSSENLINMTYENSHRYPKYEISSSGLDKVKEIKKQTKDDETEFVSKTVNFVKSLSFKQLLKIVYEAYPAYAVNSIFRG